MKLYENSSVEDLVAGFKSAREYSSSNIRSTKIQRAIRKKMFLAVFWGNTPDGVPVMYIHNLYRKDGILTRAFLVLDGKEGDGYAGEWRNGMFVLHGHAINRYIERTGCTTSRDKVVVDMLDSISITSVEHDSDTWYVSYRDGIFLCNLDGKVLHLRTYITNKQCHRNQRLWSRKAEMETEKFRRELGLYKD